MRIFYCVFGLVKIEKYVVYFTEPGPENTIDVIRAVARRLRRVMLGRWLLRVLLVGLV